MVAALSLLAGPALAPPAALAQAPDAVVAGPVPMDASLIGAEGGVSAVLVEGSTGQVLAGRDADVRRPIASAIKLLTALVVVELLPPGTPVIVGDDVRGIEGSSYRLRPGEVRSVEDLLAGLLLRSGNDAAVALAVAASGSEQAFVDAMVERLGRLGIDARPGSPSGLELDDALSARELAMVARAALAEPRIRSLVAAPVVAIDGSGTIENRNLFLSDIEGATGLKTGFTSAAGFTLAASAQRDGRELVAVVLGATDDRERRSIAARLIEHGFARTEVVRPARSLTLRTTAGPVRFATAGGPLTVRAGDSIEAVWPTTVRPDEVLTSVPLSSGGAPAGISDVERRDGRRPDLPPSLGRALADGVYAALRPQGLARTTGGDPGRLR